MIDFFKTIGKFIGMAYITIGLLLGGEAPYQSPVTEPAPYSVEPAPELENLGANNAVGGKLYYLSGAGVTAAATTITLTNFDMAGATQNLVMADFGSLGCGTIQPGSATKQEFISFTGVTQNSDGTAQLTGVSRGLAPVPPYTASTTLQTSHAGGSQFVVSNSPPCFYEGYAQLTQDEAITGLWNFNSYLPTTTISATSSTQFTNKAYVDSIANQGAATSTKTNGGIVELATGAEAAAGAALVTASPFVIDTSISSASSTAGENRAVITNINGKIDPTFLNGADAYLFKNFNASSTSANPIVLNGISFNTPNSQGTASTTLTNDGSGNLTWKGYNKTFAAPEATLLGTASSTLVNYLFAANTLGVGDVIRITANATTSSNAERVIMNLNASLGGNATSTCGFEQAISAGNATSTYTFTIRIVSSTVANLNCAGIHTFNVAANPASGTGIGDYNVPGIDIKRDSKEYSSLNATVDITTGLRFQFEGVAAATAKQSVFNVIAEWLNL